MNRTDGIGRRFRESRLALALAVVIAAAAIVGDFQWSPGLDRWRLAVALAVVALLFGVARGDRVTLGLTLVPVQGYRYWIKVTMIAGLVVVVFSAVAVAVLWLFGHPPETRSYFTDSSQFAPQMWRAVVLAPLIEEPIYRLILCAPLIALTGVMAAGLRPGSRLSRFWAGRIPTVVVSGAVFGYLHFHYGNPGPDNFIAGYILGWAYLASGTMVIPLLLHALGNLCVLAGNIAYFYYLNS